MNINEKLGIPDGINREANKLYKKLIISLDKFKSSEVTFKLDDSNPEFDVIIGKYDINIGNLNLRRVPFTLNIFYYKEVKEPELVSAAYGVPHIYKYKDGSFFSESNIDDSQLLLRIVVSENQSKSDIVGVIKNKLDTATIAHELMHMFDRYKNKKSSLISTSEYNSLRISGFPKLISDFVYLLYYTSSDENTVRPSEIYHEMLSKGITKSDFNSFMKESKIIENITKAENFSISEFKDKLNDDDDVKLFVDSISGYNRIGDYATDVLNLLMINLVNNKFDSLREMLSRYISSSVEPTKMFISSITGVPCEDFIESNKRASNFYDKIIESYKKYDKNIDKYFENLQKKLNFAGSKMKRKLYKLYDMIDYKKDTDAEKVFNWDIHNKINSKKFKKNEEFILDFRSFNKKVNSK